MTRLLRTSLFAAAFLALSSSALADPDKVKKEKKDKGGDSLAVPELSVNAGGGALLLVAGGLMLMAGRRRRENPTSDHRS